MRIIALVSTCLFLLCQSAESESKDSVEIARGTWFAVPDSRLLSVSPGSRTQPLIQGRVGAENLLTAYAGGTFDHSRQRLLVWSGGHKSYLGNEIYSFELDSRRWQRLTEPSPVSPADELTGVTSDGAPIARRTFNGLIYLPDPFDALWFQGGTVGTKMQQDLATWRYDFDDAEWQRLADAPFTAIYTYSNYDHQTGLIWHVPNKRLLSYDPMRDRWRDYGPRPGLWGNKHAAFDSKRGRLLVVGRGEVISIDVRSGKRLPNKLNTTGATEITKAVAPGLVYRPDIDKFVSWGGGVNVYSFDPETLEWSRHDPSAKNVIIPPMDTGNGIFGRFQYSQKHDLFILAHSESENVLLYRLDPNSGIADNLPKTAARIFRTGRWYNSVQAASAVAIHGDVVELLPGVYSGSPVAWAQNDITIRGLGGMAQIRSHTRHNEDDEAIWTFSGDNVHLQYLTFSSNAPSSLIGVKTTGASLSISNSRFQSLQSGIVAAEDGASLTVTDSEFLDIGNEQHPGSAIYTGTGSDLLVRTSRFSGESYGTAIVSSSESVVIEYNLMTSEFGATLDYALDLPEVANVRVVANIIKRTGSGTKGALIRVGQSPDVSSSKQIYISDNVFVDDSDSRLVETFGSKVITERNIVD